MRGGGGGWQMSSTPPRCLFGLLGVLVGLRNVEAAHIEEVLVLEDGPPSLAAVDSRLLQPR